MILIKGKWKCKTLLKIINNKRENIIIIFNYKILKYRKKLKINKYVKVQKEKKY